MSSSYGENIRVTVFGQSHGPAIGVVMDGLPAGLPVDLDRLQSFLDRRAPGRSDLTTARKEEDRPEILSGLFEGRTCGAPFAALIRNRDARSKDYSALAQTPRPGHADYTAAIKYGGAQDYRGGGHFSGRLTAPLCIAGGICLQMLEREGIRVMARIRALGPVTDDSAFTEPVGDKPFPASSDRAAAEMQQAVARAKEAGDSLGGIIECVVTGLPAGLGDPMFDGMENRISAALFAIPAIKGVEFGDGFALAGLTGSAANDPFRMEQGRVVTETNRCGGILGGITTGMPLVFRVAVKPTPSIAQPQRTVDLGTGQDTDLQITGRHDPCILPRAVPCVEAVAALAVYDAFLARKKEL